MALKIKIRVCRIQKTNTSMLELHNSLFLGGAIRKGTKQAR